MAVPRSVTRRALVAGWGLALFAIAIVWVGAALALTGSSLSAQRGLGVLLIITGCVLPVHVLRRSNGKGSR